MCIFDTMVNVSKYDELWVDSNTVLAAKQYQISNSSKIKHHHSYW